MKVNEVTRYLANPDRKDEGTPLSVGAVRDLVSKTGELRSGARFASQQADELHLEALLDTWTNLSVEFGRSGGKDLLDRLIERGFSWRHIADLCGVSIAAVRKWAKGGAVSPSNRAVLASVNAMISILENELAVSEVASWFEMPVTIGLNITPLDFYKAHRLDLVFEYAAMHSDVADVLDQFDEDWEQKRMSPFEVIVAEDGDFSIQPRNR